MAEDLKRRFLRHICKAHRTKAYGVWDLCDDTALGIEADCGGVRVTAFNKVGGKLVPASSVVFTDEELGAVEVALG